MSDALKSAADRARREREDAEAELARVRREMAEAEAVRRSTGGGVTTETGASDIVRELEALHVHHDPTDTDANRSASAAAAAEVRRELVSSAWAHGEAKRDREAAEAELKSLQVRQVHQ